MNEEELYGSYLHHWALQEWHCMEECWRTFQWHNPLWTMMILNDMLKRTCIPDRHYFPGINRTYKFGSSSGSSLDPCHMSCCHRIQTHPPSHAASEIWQADLWRIEYQKLKSIINGPYLPLWLIHWELNWATNAPVSLDYKSTFIFISMYDY